MYHLISTFTKHYPCVLICLCVLISPFYKVTSATGLELTLRPYFNLMVYKDPISIKVIFPGTANVNLFGGTLFSPYGVGVGRTL